MERQIHGFNFENDLSSVNENLKLSNGYTSKWDGIEYYEGKHFSVSIKCIKLGASVDFGDIKRQSVVSEDFILYVGFWSDSKTKKVVKYYKILITKENWNKYLGDVSILPDLFSEMALISNERSDDKKWTAFRKLYTSLYGKATIALRFKRDHKKQKRIQCGVSYSNFMNIVLKENKVI